MVLIKSFLLSSFAIAGVLSADCAGDITLDSDGDVSKFGTCNTWKGNVKVGTGVTSLSIPSLQKIDGDFTLDEVVGVTSISAPMLGSITGTWTMKSCTILSSLSFAALTTVGAIEWTTLPALKALDFTSKVTKCDRVLITDTILTSLQGINLVTATDFNINNNVYLKEIDVALGNVSNAINIEFNSKSVSVSFPDLVWAKNITVRDAASVSFPKLEEVNGTLALINNTCTEAIFPELTEVGGFAFNNNSQMTNVSAPNLESVGGVFQLANNIKLKNINGFPELTTVDGSVDFSGSFTNATLPSLDDVRGGMNIQTTEEFDCTEFKKYKDEGVVKGNGYTCAGKLSEAKSTSGGSSTSGSGSAAEDDDSSATRASVSIVALFAACAAMLAL